jgi:hypothetical protein
VGHGCEGRVEVRPLEGRYDIAPQAFFGPGMLDGVGRRAYRCLPRLMSGPDYLTVELLSTPHHIGSPARREVSR